METTNQKYRVVAVIETTELLELAHSADKRFKPDSTSDTGIYVNSRQVPTLDTTGKSP